MAAGAPPHAMGKIDRAGHVQAGPRQIELGEAPDECIEPIVGTRAAFGQGAAQLVLEVRIGPNLMDPGLLVEGSDRFGSRLPREAWTAR